MEWFGKGLTKRELRSRCGAVTQLADMRQSSFAEGKARGMRNINARTGGGLSFTILPDRCMDIAWADYAGHPLSYMSQSEISHPAYFTEKADKGFKDSFFGGLLTTCGLSNVGAPNEDEGTAYGLHGTISNVPATELSIRKTGNRTNTS